MKGEGVQPSRTAADLRNREAEAFLHAAHTSLEEAAALTVSWTRRQLIDVALTLASGNVGCVKCTIAWTEQDLRDAHAAWGRGVRTPWTTEGERVYQKLRKRAVRRVS